MLWCAARRSPVPLLFTNTAAPGTARHDTLGTARHGTLKNGLGIIMGLMMKKKSALPAPLHSGSGVGAGSSVELG